MVAFWVASLGLAGVWTSAVAQTQIPLGDKSVLIAPVVEGMNAELEGNVAYVRKQMIPSDMTPLGDGRYLISTVTGHVRLLQADWTLAPGAYLDTFDPANSPNVGEGSPGDFTQVGCTSIAAHPGFLDPQSTGYGKFYIITTEEGGTGGGGIGQDADFFDGASGPIDCVLTEWSIDPSAIHTATQLTVSGPGQNVTKREILRSQRPSIIHTVVDMVFDAEGYLIVTSGDGGGNAFGISSVVNAQDPGNIFGCVLRIDPLTYEGDTRPVGGRNNQYRIHPDNFGNTDGDPDTLAEAFAYGMRSPYRINIDMLTGDLYVGDVGAGSREEISRIVNGGNYGWGAYEGTRVAQGALIPGPGETPATGPLWELYHNLRVDDQNINEANNVVGGFVYRGSLMPGLYGKYIFADTGEDNDGEPGNVIDIYYGDLDEVNGDARTGLQRFQIEVPEGVTPPDRIWSMAQDDDGELYLLCGPDRLDLFNRTSPSETDGGIWRITAVPDPITPGDTDADGDIDDFDLITAIVNYTGSLDPGVGGKTPADGDTDGDGDVDDFDLINMITGYTGSLSVPKVETPQAGTGRIAASSRP